MLCAKFLEVASQNYQAATTGRLSTAQTNQTAMLGFSPSEEVLVDPGKMSRNILFQLMLVIRRSKPLLVVTAWFLLGTCLDVVC